MKYIFLDNRRDMRKCDPLILPSLIAGGASLLGGLFQRNSQAETNKKNLQIARETNEAQERIAAANNQTQIDMMRENNDWSAKQAELAFQREADYNSAQSQVGRYLAAGLNPALMMQNSGATSASASAPSAAGSSIHPSMPNFVTPTMQAPPSVLLNASDAISKLASSFAQMKQGENVGKQTSWIDRLNESTIKNLTVDALGKEAKAKFDSVMAQLQENYGHKEIMSRIEKNYAEACSAYASGELSTANALWADVKRDMESEQLDILRQKRPFIIAEAEETVKLIQQKQNTEKSAQSANYASAEERSESAELHRKEQKTEEAREENVRASTDNLRITAKDTEASMLEKIENSIALYLDEHGNVRLDPDKLKEVTENALKEAKNRTRQQGQDYWNPFHYIGALLGGSGAAAIKLIGK